MLKALKTEKQKHSTAGFTITEAMFVTLIFVFLMGGIYTVMHSSEQIHTQAMVKGQVQERLRQAKAALIEDLHSARGTPQVGNGTFLLFDKFTNFWTSSDYPMNYADVQRHYWHDNFARHLVLNVDGVKVKTVAPNISGFFAVQDGDRVTITLDAEKTTIKGVSYDESITFNVYLRNKNFSF